jgi:2-amino-4-hydroxy-6-hydroxymethyldihydropteridine diphosphokinase
MSERVFIALGTNLGDREANLQRAKTALSPEVHLVRESSIYETAPWGFKDQPDFLNQVIEARTDLSPRALLAHLKAIEARLGRQKTFRNGPRLIDLDILFYGSRIIRESDLQIPHPRLADRAFVLVPLAELAPDFLHPRRMVTIRALLERVDAGDVTRR